MKVVLVSLSDVNGGAAVVTYRLKQVLCREGVDARMLVLSRSVDDDSVAVLGNSLSRKWKFLWERGVIYLRNGFDRADLFKVSIADTGFDITRHPWVKDADVVMLNWINQGMMSLADVRRLAAVKPVIWTMHDMWCMTGACHHAHECERFTGECGCCPYFNGGAREHDLSRSTWRRKRALYDSVPLHFVAVSNWVARKAAESSLLGQHRISVIPNAFPVDEYRVAPVSQPEMPGVDFTRRLILMGAARLDDPIKGLEYAIKSLNIFVDRYPDETARCQAVFFGDMRRPELLQQLRMPYRHIGRVSDPQALRDLYASAEVVLSSSLYETLPGTLIEGQAAGCVPVSFGRGGQADIIDHRVNGYLARYLDCDDMADGIRWALDSNLPRPAQHDSVVARFSSTAVARRYIALCRELISCQSEKEK